MTAVREQRRSEGGSACPDCGHPVDPSQPFCLECGRRIARSYRRPPNWRIPLALIASLVVAAGVFAGYGITQLTGTDEPAKDITVTTGPGGTEQQADPGETPQAAAPAPTPPPAPAPAQPAQPTGPVAWPQGQKAYTVVLLTTKDKGDADKAAQGSVDKGQAAGVLESDDFKRFDPGLFVVFAGQYDNVEAASDKAGQLGADNPGAYARFVEPK